MSGVDIPVRAVREQIASAVNIIVHLHRFRDGGRRITHVTEVVGMEGDVITLQDIYLYDYSMGIAEDGAFLGRLKATGIRPSASAALEERGVELPAELFKPEKAGKK